MSFESSLMSSASFVLMPTIAICSGREKVRASRKGHWSSHFNVLKLPALLILNCTRSLLVQWVQWHVPAESVFLLEEFEFVRPQTPTLRPPTNPKLASTNGRGASYLTPSLGLELSQHPHGRTERRGESCKGTSTAPFLIWLQPISCPLRKLLRRRCHPLVVLKTTGFHQFCKTWSSLKIMNGDSWRWC